MTTHPTGPTPSLPRPPGLPFLAAAALVLLLAGWPDAARARLRFAIQEFEPFTYNQDGLPRGAAVECVFAVCKAMGEQCGMDIYPWPRAQIMVRKGELDGLFVLGFNPGRAAWLRFSPPLMETEYGFFTRRGSPFSYEEPRSLSGLTIGVYGPSNTSHTLMQLLKDAPSAAMDMRPDDESGFVKLSLGRVDAVFSNKEVGLAVVGRLGLGNVVYAGRQSVTTYYVAFSHHADIAKVRQFNHTLATLQRNGIIPAILSRYGMTPPKDLEVPK
ncbi:MAG: substrate-binding periplasmic protein [Thermodesulfobacteriota bacterium]